MFNVFLENVLLIFGGTMDLIGVVVVCMTAVEVLSDGDVR